GHEVLGLGDRPELLEDVLLLLGADGVERGDLEDQLVDLVRAQMPEDLGGALRPGGERHAGGLAPRGALECLGAGLFEGGGGGMGRASAGREGGDQLSAASHPRSCWATSAGRWSARSSTFACRAFL